jgi:hypothetical protein
MSTVRNKRYVFINSNLRNSGTHSNFEYQIELPNSDVYDRVVLLSASIPKSYYLVAAPYNTFVLDEAGMTVTISMPEGNYNYKNWIQMLETKLNANSPHSWTYAVTYPNVITGPSTGKYTYTVTGNSGVQPIFRMAASGNLKEQFGFDTASVNTFVADSLVSTNVIKFQLADSIYIHSNITSGSSTEDVLEVITVDSPDYSAVTYQLSGDIHTHSKALSSQSNNTYSFVLTDENGVELDLNGCNVNFQLLIYKSDTTNMLIEKYIKYRTKQN